MRWKSTRIKHLEYARQLSIFGRDLWGYKLYCTRDLCDYAQW